MLKNGNQFKFVCTMIYLIILFCLSKINICNNIITIKIKGSGNQMFINKNRTQDVTSVSTGNTHINFFDSNVIPLEGEESTIKIEFYLSQMKSLYNLFKNCENITEIDLSDFNSSSVNDLALMFEGCTKLKSINFQNFDTSKVTTMEKMFKDCISLESLYLSNFITINVINMCYMFKGCNNLISLDITNFNTSEVNYMQNIFEGCSKIYSLDLFNFNTSKVLDMTKMFDGCNNLKYINISNFDTTKVTSMEKMFKDCFNLESLNLSNFNRNNATNICYMFNGCNKLISLDITNLYTSEVIFMQNMFEGCSQIYSLDLSHFNTSNVKNLMQMFDGCNNLNYLDISTFDTTQVTSMEKMFQDCHNLISLNLTKFNTDNVENMCFMFKGCINLNTLDLTNFNTSNVTYMHHMFEGCIKLSSLNLFNFKTPKVVDMEQMFDSCYALNFLDISNFDISKVTNMEKMFKDCYNLISLNLSNFKTSAVEKVCYMFDGCINLTLLDISNFLTSKVKYMQNMFYKCSKLNSLDLSNFETSQVVDMEYMFTKCSNLKSLNLSNFNTYNVEKMCFMFQGCSNLKTLNLSNFDTSKVTLIQYMFDGCSNLESLDLSNFDTYKVVDMEQLFKECINLRALDLSNFDASLVNNINNIFYNCNNLEILDLSNFKSPINKELDGLSLASNKLKYINLNNTLFSFDSISKTILKNIHHNIIICLNTINETIINYNGINITNYCGDKWEQFLPIIYKQNNTNELLTYISNSIIINTNKNDNENLIISNTSEILLNFSNLMEKDDIDIISTIFGKEMVSLLKNIENENYFEEIDNKKYYLSILSNQDKLNSSFLDLGNDCLNLLIEEKIINGIDDLVIFKIENEIEGFNIPIIEYEIYAKNGTKLNLDICKNINITLFIPVSINEDEIFKYDPNSSFYNDICNKYTTENDTDMTLYDRKNEFNNNNLSLCEVNCTFKGYNQSTSQAECDCIINSGLKQLDNNQNDLIIKLIISKNNINGEVMKCSGLLTDTENLKSNPGFFLLIFILVIFIIIFIIFCVKGYNSLKRNIQEVIDKRFTDNEENKIIKSYNIINSNKNNKIKKIIKKSRKKIKQKIQSRDNTKKNFNSSIKIDKSANVKNITPTQTNNESNELKLAPPENDYELNNASFEDAKRFDKRSSGDYYCSLLKRKQIFIFSMFNFDDNNSNIIRKYILFLSFVLHYSINAFFFNDSNMHQIFLDNGNYNISYQIPYIFISAVLSTVSLRIMVSTLVLTDKSIYEIKCQPNLMKANELKEKALKKIIIKFSIFFGLNLALLVIVWYYLSCWNAVYENTKVYLIKNTLPYFSLSLSPRVIVAPYLILKFF